MMRMSPTVLLFEDDASIRDVLQVMLTDDGHTVSVCDTPAQVRLLGAQTPSVLAVVDFWLESQAVLSDRDRAELLHLTSVVPTILVTARGWASRYGDGDLGLLAIVRKPFDVAELSTVVGSWVSRLTVPASS